MASEVDVAAATCSETFGLVSEYSAHDVCSLDGAAGCSVVVSSTGYVFVEAALSGSVRSSGV